MRTPIETTCDEIGRGMLKLLQPRKGYRFNVDALWLANFVAESGTPAQSTIIDLGCGCGIVGLLLAKAFNDSRVVLVEVQPVLAELARHNAMINALAERTSIAEGDLRQRETWAGLLGAADLCVSNPPFFRTGAGLLSDMEMTAIAKHEVLCTLGELVRAASTCVRVGGHFALIHDARRTEELMQALARHGFQIRRRRKVQPKADSEPHRVLVLAELVNDQGAADPAAEWEAPLVVHDDSGAFTPEALQNLEAPCQRRNG